MKAKLNKKKIILCVVILITLITLPSFGRYIYNSARDLYLKSQNFSFSSNLLTNTGKTYKYANWSGVDDYEIDIELYSYENELSLFEYDGDGLVYNLTCVVDDESKATAHIGTSAGSSTESSYIPNETNIKDVKIYLKPTENLKVGDTVKLTVTASTTEHQKTITATFNIRVTGQGVTYSIEDEETSIYATVKLINTKTVANTITLSWDPSKVVIDVTDEYYENRDKTKDTNRNVNGVEYINSITFTMEPTDVNNIRFYKKDITVNYTYPGNYGSMIVTIKESN